MTLQVEPVTRLKDRREFLRLPFRLHASDPCWVPPLLSDIREKLNPRRHPFFSHGEAGFFLARRNGRVAGRVAALVDRAHNEFHGEKAAGFGLIEFERDPEVVRALLDRAASFAAERGMELLRGPLSYSTNEECGALVEGFHRTPSLMMPYNPPWYPEIFESLGLSKARDLLAYFIDHESSFDRLGRIANRVAARNKITARPVDLERFTEQIDLIHSLYNAAWERNWGFVPMKDEEFRWHAKKMRQVIVPELVLIAEVDGRPAGFSLSLPDLSPAIRAMKGRLLPWGIFRFLRERRKIKGIRVAAMGIKAEFRGLGVEGVLIQKTIEAGMKKGFTWAELSWVLEENLPMRKLAENLGAKAYKRYRIYEAFIGARPW